MSKNSNLNSIENEGFNQDNKESDYKNLITRLKEIKTTIGLLEKIIIK